MSAHNGMKLSIRWVQKSIRNRKLENLQMHEIKQHSLKANGSKKNLRGHTFSWDKDHENTTYQNSWSVAKADLRGKFIAIITHYNKKMKKKSPNKNQPLCLMQRDKANWAKSWKKEGNNNS